MAKLTALRGTRDLVTPEIVRWHEMEEAARRVLGNACFTEIRTPVFERTALFERGVGEATDIVQKEMYSFETRSGDAVTLRPENTAGVVRAYLELGLAGKLPAPLKVWYAGPMFRYERPQKGRQRQFHQVGVEVIDTSDPRSDAEVIIVACEYLRDLGLDDLVVDLNSLGDAEDRARHREDLIKFLRGVEDKLDEDSRNRLERNPLRVLDSKNEKTREAVADAPMLPEYLGPEAGAHFEDVKALLDGAGVKYRLVPSLVRGLDYYSRTTFEIQSEKLGAQSTVCGGGRYDGLVEQLGGSRVPAVGWALGLERLSIILDEVRGKPEQPGPAAYIVSLGDAAKSAVLPLATELRRAGVRCDVSFSGGGFGKQFKAADRRGAHYAVVLGDEEVRKGTVSVKHLGSGEQQEMERSALADFLLREGAGS